MSEMITIQVTGADQAAQLFERLLQKAHNLHKPMSSIGSFLTKIMEESFDTETSPDGHVWHPLKIRTIHDSYDGNKRYTKKGVQTKHFQKFSTNRKILQDSRTLRESTGYSADSDSVIVGVNAYSKDQYPYPIVHQFGTDKAGRNKDVHIEARPFMPITQGGELYDNINEEVLDILLGYLGE